MSSWFWAKARRSGQDPLPAPCRPALQGGRRPSTQSHCTVLSPVPNAGRPTSKHRLAGVTARQTEPIAEAEGRPGAPAGCPPLPAPQPRGTKQGFHLEPLLLGDAQAGLGQRVMQDLRGECAVGGPGTPPLGAQAGLFQGDWEQGWLFLSLHPRHRLGLNSGLQLPACTTATAIWDLSRICDPHRSSWQHQILKPLREARDGTHSRRDTRQIRYRGAAPGTPQGAPPCRVSHGCKSGLPHKGPLPPHLRPPRPGFPLY